MFYVALGFPGGSDGKESVCNAGDPGSIPGLGMTPWRRKWQPTSVFLSGEFHGPWGLRESDTAEQLRLSLYVALPPHWVASSFSLRPLPLLCLLCAPFCMGTRAVDLPGRVKTYLSCMLL